MAVRATYPAHTTEGALPTHRNLALFEEEMKCVNKKSALFLLSW